LKESAMFNAATIARAGRAGLACLVGSVLVILSALVAEAFYGPRTTIGANYQQTSNTMSTDGINEGVCVGVSVCYILLQVPPQQKALIVQHVSCIIIVTAGEISNGLLRTRKGQTFPLRHTRLVPVLTTGTTWVVNSPVKHLGESGERPVVSFPSSAAATWTIECSISGTLQQP
jgi:hypothetical protein